MIRGNNNNVKVFNSSLRYIQTPSALYRLFNNIYCFRLHNILETQYHIE